MTATTPGMITKLRKSGAILSNALAETAAAVKPGIRTTDLDAIARAAIELQGGKPAFLGYRGFPASLCTSRNDVVVHGIPRNDIVLEDGDIVGLDLGVNLDGAFTDMAVTVPVGTVPKNVRRLITTTTQSLAAGLDVLRAGVRTGNLGAAIQSVVEKAGFSVVRDFVGHGVGASVHEEPQIPNFGTPGMGSVLQEGSVIAIEPMVNMGGPEVRVENDGWTVRTRDGSRSAHIEVTVLVTADGFTYITPPLP